MRAVRYSRTFADQFIDLLAQGERAFGEAVATDKKQQVLTTVEHFLARHPDAKRPHPILGLRVYPISKTPFVVLYDFDDAELRVHFIVPGRADLSAIDPSTVAW